VNVLIDGNGRARLTGFSLIAMASDQSTVISPAMVDGTIPWMSPELLDPGTCYLKESRPTKESDCYALGMVIYEVLSGRTPFDSYRDPEVVLRVLSGERPARPQGDEGRLLTDNIWEILGRCWTLWPSDRPSAKAILLGLEGNPLPLGPLSDPEGDTGTDVDDWSDAAWSESGTVPSPHSRVIFIHPCIIIGLPISRSGSRLQGLPLMGIPKRARPSGGSARGSRKKIRATNRPGLFPL